MPSPRPQPTAPEAEEALVREVIWLSRNVLGLTLGMMFGAGLFLATLILVIKGGPHPGANLQLLNQFFPGYRVTYLGSFVGLFYGLLVGYISGFGIAIVYNWVASFRHR